MLANCEDTAPLSLNCGQTHTQPTEFRGKIPSYPGKDQNEVRLKAQSERCNKKADEHDSLLRIHF